MKPWLEKLFSVIPSPLRRASSPRPRYRRVKLRLEQLEDRLAPASYNWNNAAGGDWDTVSNWSVNSVVATQLPGAADDVGIGNLNAGASITHASNVVDSVNSITASAPISLSAGSLSVASNFSDTSAVIVSGGTLNFSTGTAVSVASLSVSGSGALTVAGGSTVNVTTAFTMSSGTLSGAGTVTDSGTASWTGGTMTGSGTTDFNGTTTISGSPTLAGGWSAGGTGAITFSSGTLTAGAGGGTISSTAFTINGGTVVTTGTLTLSGTSSWTGGTVDGGGGLDVTGTLTLSGTSTDDLGSSSAAGTIKDSGAINQTGTGSLQFSFSSALDILSGGIYNLQSDAGFTTNGGVNTITNSGVFEKTQGTTGSAINPAFNNTGGTISVAAATLTLAGGGASTGGAFTVSSGAALDLTGSASCSGAYTVSGGGTVNLNSGTFTVPSAGATIGGSGFIMNGGTVVTTGTLTLSGTSSWTGGTVDGGGGLDVTGTLTLSGTSTDDLGSSSAAGTIKDSGAINQTGTGSLQFSFSSALDILSGGIYNLQSDAGFTTNGGVNTITNSGVFEKTQGTTGSAINPAFNNTGGTISVAAATLTLAGGGASTGGAFTVSSGAALDLTGSASCSGAYTVSGGGTVNLNSGTFTVPSAGATIAGSGFTINGGAVLTTGTLTLSGTGSWTGGTIYGGGGLDVTGTLTLSAGASNDWLLGNSVSGGAGTISDSGTINQTGTGSFEFYSSTLDILSGGVYNLQSNAGFTTNGGVNTIANSGTFEKTQGTATSTIAPRLSNTGVVAALAATFSFTGSVTQISGSTLTAGTWNVGAGSTLSLPSSITTIGSSASVTLSGSGASFTSLSGLSGILPGGSFTIESGANFTTTASTLANAGAVTIGAGSALAGPSTFTYSQTGGSTLDNGTLDPDAVTLSGGTLSGPGTIAANVTNSGATIYPSGMGGPGGTLAITGAYTQQTGGTLDIDIGGTSTGQFDVLSVSGTATLAGMLNVALANNFVPSNNQTFQVMTFAQSTGNFGTLTGLSPYFTEQLNPTNLDLVTAAQQNQTISFGPLANQIYGNAPLMVSATASSGLTVSFSIIAGGQYASISGTAITILGATPAGSVVTIAAAQSGNANYYPAPTVDQSFTIAPYAFTYQIANDDQTYGTAANLASDLGATIPTPVNGQNLDIAYSSSGDTATADVGGYAINGVVANGTSPNAGLAANYTVTLDPGTLQVNTADLYITATANSKTYGATASDTGTLSGVVNNDGITASFSSAGDAATASVAGSPYAITYTLSDPNNKLGNYTVVYTPGNLTVGKADLYVTATANSKTYGATASDTGTLSGVVNNDGITASFSSAGDAATASVAGSPYAITYTLSDPNNELGNYTVVYTPANLTVGKANLYITATANSKTYGATASDTGTLSGVVNNDGITASFSSAGDAATASVAGSPYAITYTLSDPNNELGNYTVVYTAANLTVGAAHLYVTATANSKTYGATAGDTGTVSGVVNNDGITASFSSAGDAASASVAGSPYAITYTLSDPNNKLGNYTVVYTPGNLTVGAAHLYVTATANSKTYGTTASDTGTVSGVVNNDGITASFSSAGDAATASVAGSPYAITYTLSDPNNELGNYTVVYTPANLTVGKANLYITATANSKTYGATASDTGTLSGVVNNDGITASFSSAGDAATASVAGSPYAITYTLSDPNNELGNYTVVYTAANLTVGAAHLYVTATANSKTYGATAGDTGTVSGVVNNDGITASFSSAGDAASASVAGSPYAITYTLSDPNNKLGNYTVVYTPGNLTVGAAHLYVTATANSKTYGTTASDTGTVSGVVNNDGITASFSSAGDAATASVAGSPYAITYTLSDPNNELGNYTVVYTPANLTVGKANLYITATANSKTYGATASDTGTLSGVVNNDGITASFSSAGDAATASVAGSPYAITYTLSDPNNELGNYTVVYTAANLTVGAAHLYVTATANSKTYGATAGDTGTVSGVVNNDGITASFSSAGDAASASVAGSPYAITYTLSDPNNKLGNYTVVYTPGNLTVGAAHLYVTATANSKTYGTTASDTGTVSGVVNNDGITASFSSAGDAATASVAGSPYAITYTLSDPNNELGNYTVVYTPANLTVGKANLYITATANSKTYGATASDTGTLSGVVNNDGITASFSSAGDAATASVAGSPYAITYTLSDPNNELGNYTVVYTAANLTVGAAHLYVTATANSKTYGATAGDTGTVSGVVNNDGITASFSSAGDTASASVAGSPYAITYTLSDPNNKLGNYTVVYTPGNLTVGKADLYVTATANSKTYGATASDTGTLSGVVNNDGVTASFSSAGDAATASVAGSPYAITYTLSDPNNELGNYTVVYTAANLTVGAAHLYVTATANSKTYGATAGDTGTVSGVVNNDGITASFSSAGDAASASVAGSPYAITYTLSDPNNKLGNYTVVYTPGNLTVGKADLYVTATANSKTYGATASDTGTVSGVVNNDGVTASFSSAGDAATASVAGSPYAITYTLSDPNNELGNYTVVYTPANLTVGKANLYITATANSKTYGATASDTGTLSGVVNNDGITASFSSAGDAATASVAGSPYPITYTLSDPNNELGNYTVVYTAANLTVGKADLYVTATANSKTYGTTASDTGTLSGVVNNDGITASFSSAGDAATATVAGSPYPITYTLSDPNNKLGNYTVVYTAANLTVNTAVLTITANSNTKTYGTTLTFAGTEFTSSGLVNGNSVTSVTLTSAGAPAAGPLGANPIVPSAAVGSGLNNYSINYVDGTLRVVMDQSILVLDPTAGGALNLSGNAVIKTPGNVWVDSTNAQALQASGNASVTAASIDVVGKAQSSGNAVFHPAPLTGSADLPDPLASLAMPSTTGLTDYGAVNVSGNGSATIKPGIYTQIQVSGNGSLTMQSGNYIIEGGGFNISGNASVTGSQMMIFNGGSDYPNAGGSFNNVNLSGNGAFNVTPPSTGAYAGIVIFQPRANTQALNISGNAVASLVGTVYAPSAQLQLSGNGALNASLIVDTADLSGNIVANALGDNVPGTVAYTPAQIRQAYGINSLAEDGAGQTIAIVTAYDDPSIYAALDTFDTQFGLTSSGPNLYQQYGPAATFLQVIGENGQATALPGTDPAGIGVGNWAAEESLDAEWAHAIAPGAQIILVECNSDSLPDLMQGVATAASQPGVSVVTMSWGFTEGQSVIASDEALYDQTFAKPGVTFVASTGDFGTANPEYPAFSPNVVAVGGATLTLNAANSYTSETGWGYYSTGLGKFIGSGGGVSRYEGEPAYQQGVQSTGYRTNPDVSIVGDPNTGVWLADPYDIAGANPFEIVGGTSVGAPMWAGLFALVDQGRTAAGEAPLNSTSPTGALQGLYTLPQTDYNVIAGGTNGGFNAAAGYNLVTGLGTPIANHLVPDLIAYQGSGAFATTGLVAPINSDLNANSTNVQSGANGSITILNLSLPSGLGHEFESHASAAEALPGGPLNQTQSSAAGDSTWRVAADLPPSPTPPLSFVANSLAAGTTLFSAGRLAAAESEANGLVFGWSPAEASTGPAADGLVDGSARPASRWDGAIDEFRRQSGPAIGMKRVQVDGDTAGNGLSRPTDDPIDVDVDQHANSFESDRPSRRTHEHTAVDNLFIVAAPILAWYFAIGGGEEHTRKRWLQQALLRSSVEV